MSRPPSVPDVIVLADTIETMTRPGRAEAVAVSSGRIVAVGNREDVLLTRGARTTVVDLGTRALLPGFFEPHTHPDVCAQFSGWVDVSSFRHARVADVEAELAAAVERTPTGEWIFAFGFDPILTADLGRWDRARLDAITDRHPVFVMIQSMHTAYVNTLGLVRAGVALDADDPGDGGHYGRDAAGLLNGRLEEQPAMAAFAPFFLGSADATRTSMRSVYDAYRTVGITSIGVAGTFGDPAMLADVAREAPVRTTAYYHSAMADRLDRADRIGDRYRVRGLKLWYDGSPYTGTMLLDEPYLENDLCCCTLGIAPGTAGRANFDPADMVDLLAGLYADGWQVMAHSQGDRGCREMLDLYGRVVSADADHRWRLEHCALISTDDLVRAKQLGVSPSFHVNHVLHYGPELRDQIIGPERAEQLMPIGPAVEMGHRVSLHADAPMYPTDPLSLVRTAVTRRTRHGDRLAGHFAIDVRAALRAVTIDAAWQLGADDDTGSIEVGKRADFTVLERDPFDVAVDDLHRIEVLDTWLDGRSTTEAGMAR
ncbi:MAG: amidohydrolase [Actinobacteria bacterium]|nr:amidohydrolase [Actinomycetota bacterium]